MLDGVLLKMFSESNGNFLSLFLDEYVESLVSLDWRFNLEVMDRGNLDGNEQLNHQIRIC